MSKIKIKYRAYIEYTDTMDEDTPGLLPFSEIRQNMKAFTENLTVLLQNEMDTSDNGCIAVIEIEANAWREDEKD